MKILHVGATDCAGGASRAAFRLHQALTSRGVDSRMLVRRKSSDDPKVKTSGEEDWFQSFLEKITTPFERSLRRITGNPTGSMWTFGFIPNRLASQINASEADVVHLHWLGAGYLPLWSLPKIEKPIVWTLHDLWPILGVGHYDNADRDYSRGLLHFDWEEIAEKWKHRMWGDLKISAVGPSPWVVDELCRRAGRPGWKGNVIPYGLDTNVFHPVETEGLRAELGISKTKPVLVFGALDATSDRRKGADLLERTLEELAKRRANLQLIVFGDRPGDPLKSHGFDIFRMGPIHDDRRLAAIYSLGDVFMFTSREETFGQTASESLSCGTPVVGFRAAGQQSVFRHREQGYLAEPYSPQDMTSGVQWVIEESSKGRNWTESCRQFALEEYSLEKYADSYLAAYEEALIKGA
jgi:glycosyltransferase involved in cell wall biosynthesis